MNFPPNHSSRLESNLNSFKNFVVTKKLDFTKSSQPKKWSGKEIIGHLVDSARYNLMRFTEVLAQDEVYQVIPYQQDKLVKINLYQEVELNEILNLWLSLNIQIIHVIEKLNESELQKAIQLPDESMSDLNFLIEDYINHLEHHLKQIYSVSPS